MIITCTSCHTHYEISQDAMPAEGRKVRCTKCKHLWHAMPESQQEEERQPIAESSVHKAHQKESNPRPKPKSTPAPVSAWLVAMPMLLGCIALMLIMVGAYHPISTQFPFTEKIYNLVGIKTSLGVMFDDVRLRLVDHDGVASWKVEGVIQNTSHEQRALTPVRFDIMDKDKKVIATHTMQFKRAILEPEGEHFFEADITYPDVDKVAYISLDIGNKLELRAR